MQQKKKVSKEKSFRIYLTSFHSTPSVMGVSSKEIKKTSSMLVAYWKMGSGVQEMWLEGDGEGIFGERWAGGGGRRRGDGAWVQCKK